MVFNIGMVGYSESLTDPSYNGQVLESDLSALYNIGHISINTIGELEKRNVLINKGNRYLQCASYDDLTKCDPILALNE